MHVFAALSLLALREGGWRGGAATRKIYRVFLRTGEGQSPGEGRGGRKSEVASAPFFASGMRKMTDGRPHTLHKWCAACVYET
jgi:hypothetical protein